MVTVSKGKSLTYEREKSLNLRDAAAYFGISMNTFRRKLEIYNQLHADNPVVPRKGPDSREKLFTRSDLEKLGRFDDY